MEQKDYMFKSLKSILLPFFGIFNISEDITGILDIS